jgi:hypothetical protein
VCHIGLEEASQVAQALAGKRPGLRQTGHGVYEWEERDARKR